ncbi:MAG: hypothetical protein AAGD25_10270 [Cyanobacteria bacterium P01_F01_bin.150]
MMQRLYMGLIVLWRPIRSILIKMYLFGIMFLGAYVGYHYGHHLIPLAFALADGTFFEAIFNWFAYSFIENSFRWGSAVILATAGGVGYRQHYKLIKLREANEFSFDRYSSLVAIPGFSITDFIWAHATGFVLVVVPLSITFFVVIVLPCLITQNFLLRIVLVIFLSGGGGVFLNGSTKLLEEAFRPHLLERELRNADKTGRRMRDHHEARRKRKDKQRKDSDREVRRDDW